MYEILIKDKEKGIWFTHMALDMLRDLEGDLEKARVELSHAQYRGKGFEYDLYWNPYKA